MGAVEGCRGVVAEEGGLHRETSGAATQKQVSGGMSGYSEKQSHAAASILSERCCFDGSATPVQAHIVAVTLPPPPHTEHTENRKQAFACVSQTIQLSLVQRGSLIQNQKEFKMNGNEGCSLASLRLTCRLGP